MTSSRSQRAVFALLALALAALACNAPIQQPATLPASASPTTTTAPLTSPCGLGDLKTAGGQDVSNWLIQCDNHDGFGFKYPPGGPPTPLTDDRAPIYLPIVPNTTLVEKWIEVEPVEGSAECSSANAQNAAPGAVTTETLTINGVDFKKESGGGVATGNIYDWEAYSTGRDYRCVTLTFTLHYTDAANYVSPPAVFDRAAESAVFRAIMETFRWVSS